MNFSHFKLKVLIVSGLLLLNQNIFAQELESKFGEPITKNNSEAIKDTDIDMVISHLRNNLSPKINVQLEQDFSQYILLKDGSIYSDGYISPYILNVKKSKLIAKKDWGIWKKSGATISVKFKDKWLQWKNWKKVLPASKNQKVSGIYKSIGPFYASRVYKFNTVILRNDGTFELRYFYLKRSKLNPNTKEYQPHSKDKKVKGTYQLNGYEIALKFNSGKEEKFLFGFSQKEKGIILGKNIFFQFSHPLLKL